MNNLVSARSRRCRSRRPFRITVTLLPIVCALAVLPAASSAAARGWLGVSVQDVTESLREAMDLGAAAGALVSDVAPDSPAERAGIRAGDVIVRVEKSPVETSADLVGYLRGKEEGERVDVLIQRGGAEEVVRVTLGPAPGRSEKEKKPDRRLPMPDLPDIVKPLGGSPTLGVRVQSLDRHLAPYFDVEPDEGLLILGVVPGSPAEQSGLLPGDVILELNGERVATVEDLRARLHRLSGGDDFNASIIRKGQREEVRGRIERGWEHPQRPGLARPRLERQRSRDSRILDRAERRMERELDRLREQIRRLERRLERMERR